MGVRSLVLDIDVFGPQEGHGREYSSLGHGSFGPKKDNKYVFGPVKSITQVPLAP